jgi:xylose isomerase
MAEHLRFSMAYWHTMTGSGSDPFGGDVFERPWHSISNPIDQAKARIEAAFELLSKLGLPFVCFHDQDIAPTGDTLKESFSYFDKIAEFMKKLLDDSGVKLLWGTARLFMDKKYMHGAGTSPQVDVYAHAAAQVKKCMEITKYLDGTPTNIRRNRGVHPQSVPELGIGFREKDPGRTYHLSGAYRLRS